MAAEQDEAIRAKKNAVLMIESKVLMVARSDVAPVILELLHESINRTNRLLGVVDPQNALEVARLQREKKLCELAVDKIQNAENTVSRIEAELLADASKEASKNPSRTSPVFAPRPLGSKP